ncbi:MAG: ERF family protein [Burkholderiaceae bacterium]
MNQIIEMNEPEFNVIQKQESAVATPANLLQIAVQRGANMEELQKLMDLQERYEANQARKAYVDDMAKFKENPPEIFKDKAVGYTNKDGTFTGYKHASIGNVTTSIVEGLAKHGFAHRWDTEQVDGGQIVVTCIITHRLGHSEKTTLQASRDDSGKKNNIQQMSSTITYLQRYTLLAATGLATQDQEDDDGAGAKSKEPTKALPIITGKAFDRAVASVKSGEYSAANIASYYSLTDDQKTVLDDAQKGRA